MEVTESGTVTQVSPEHPAKRPGSMEPSECRLDVRQAHVQPFLDDPAVDSLGLVALHLHRCVPQPLRLAVRIRQIDGDLVQADFLPLSEAGQAALERHVFLHHRRQIAESRQAVRTGG